MRFRLPRPPGILLVAASWLAVALGGCAALSGPTAPAPATPSKVAQAQATHEYPAPRPPVQRATGGSGDAAAAVRAFATAYINWNAANVTRRMQVLAAASIGQARSAMALAAAQTAGDYELKQGGIANRGTVEAVAPLRGRDDQWVVVTREQTTATNTTAYEGLRPAWHVALATAVRMGDGTWVLSRWQPES